MLRESVIQNLSSKIDGTLIGELMDSYEQLLAKHRSCELEQALTKAGRFVEHVFRVIEFIRTGLVPLEIKAVQKSMQTIEGDTSIPDSLRFMIPRAAYGMIYNLRSKRNAVHVKEIDPAPIDVSLAVAAASWIIAELLRTYHTADNGQVEQAMLALSRTALPLVEAIGGETFIGEKVPAQQEMLLLLAHAKPAGRSRLALGEMAKCSQPSVTKALRALDGLRHVHLAADKTFYITSTGERALAEWLVARPAVTSNR